MATQAIPKDCLALITGATGGIGKATCLALASLGCNIAVHYNSAASTAKELVSQLESTGVKAHAFQADLSAYEPTRKLHKDVTAAFGKSPDILFNNAGLTLGKAGIKDINEVSIEDFELTWRANCGTAFLLTQLCLPHMERVGWGRVIFCSSVAAFIGGVVGPHYSSSKSAIHGLVHWISQYYCAKGITANAVAPALIAGTSMLPGENDELAKMVLGILRLERHGLDHVNAVLFRSTEIPLGRLGRTEEIAETVLWMVKTGYVTNKVIGVDGGLFAQ